MPFHTVKFINPRNEVVYVGVCNSAKLKGYVSSTKSRHQLVYHEGEITVSVDKTFPSREKADRRAATLVREYNPPYNVGGDRTLTRMNIAEVDRQRALRGLPPLG